MKLGWIVLAGALLAACGQQAPASKEASSAAAPAPEASGPVRMSVAAASGNATSDTGGLEITGPQPLNEATSLEIRTQSGKVYELAFVNQPDLEEHIGGGTWNTVLNPSN